MNYYALKSNNIIVHFRLCLSTNYESRVQALSSVDLCFQARNVLALFISAFLKYFSRKLYHGIYLNTIRPSYSDRLKLFNFATIESLCTKQDLYIIYKIVYHLLHVTFNHNLAIIS